jgi:hypothetical protein
VPFASEPLILAAADRLQREAHPIFMVGVMAMLRAASVADPGTVEQALKQGIPWGGAEDRAFLDEFFRLPGAPDPDQPYRAIWRSGGRKGEL